MTYRLRKAGCAAAVAVGLSLAAAATATAPAASGSQLAAGTLNLQGSLSMVSRDAVCPDGVPLAAACHSRTAQGGISGLGRVTTTYMYNGDFTLCGAGEVKIRGYTTSLRVVGKGEIHVAVADAPTCLTADLPALNAT